MFQGSLYDVYTNRKWYANIDSLADMDESGIPIEVEHWGLIVDIFGDEQAEGLVGNLRKKLVSSAMDDSVMGRVAKTGKVAGLERTLRMPMIYQQYVRNDGSSYLHSVSECPR